MKKDKRKLIMNTFEQTQCNKNSDSINLHNWNEIGSSFNWTVPTLFLFYDIPSLNRVNIYFLLKVFKYSLTLLIDMLKPFVHFTAGFTLPEHFNFL